MKKLVLSLAVLFAVGMVSCGSNDKKEACDSVPCDTTEEVTNDTAATEVVEGAVVEEGAQEGAEEAPVADSAAAPTAE